MSMEQEFRLEAVLRHREHLAQNAQQAFAAAHGKWLKANQMLDDLRRSRDQYRHELSTKLHQRFQAEEIIMYNRYLERLKTEVVQQKTLVAQLAEARETQRRLLVTAVKNRKMIEKLKSRHEESRACQSREREQKLLGEASISRHQARMRNADPDASIPDPVADIG